MTNETQNNVAQEVVAFPQLNKPAPGDQKDIHNLSVKNNH